MTALPPHRAEREALCDLLLEKGPTAPTLNEGWRTEDLAAHLYVREHDLIAAQGIIIRPLAGLHERGIAATKRRLAYEVVVEQVRTGPPLPMRLIDSLVNLQEFFIHHEDVRRGSGDRTPRPLDEIADVEALLWRGLERTASFMTRRIPGVAVDLVTDEGVMIRTGKAPQRLTLVGRPGELALYLSGRRDAANVRIECSASARPALDGASLGI